MNVRRTRLVTGLVLLTYLATHLLNHSLGLISLDAMEWGRSGFLALWRNPIGTSALYGSLLTHFGLALWSLYQRRHLRLPLWEALQLLLGLTIPPLLTVHAVGTRLTHEWFGVNDSYNLVVLTLWHASPLDGLRQSILITIAWLHGSIGLHFWLRLRPWYRRVAPILLGCTLLLPVLALLGFSQAGHEVSSMIARDPNWIERVLQSSKVPPRSRREVLYRVDDAIILSFAALVALTLVARAARYAFERRGRIRVSYPDGREVQVLRNFSVLEASRFAGIPHASVCGGRGRCSTCRVRVTQGFAALPAPSADEQKVLQRVGALPNVRLACQLRPTRNLAVTPLLPASAQASDGFTQPSYLAGQERIIAVLFADIRTFTGIAEQKLPYDLVFLLNSYFEAVGEAIVGAGGMVDKLIGVGIHCGAAIVGRMGFGAAVHVTAIGDTVNVASRLQDATKEFNCQLVISDEAAKQSGLHATNFPRHELTVRNRREPLNVFAIDDVQTIEGIDFVSKKPAAS